MPDSRDVTKGFRFVSLVLALVSVFVGGCGLSPSSRAAAPPQHILRAYADALARGDAARAYALLDASDRRAIDPQAYARIVARDAAEARELAARLAHAPPARVSAQIELDDGTELSLAFEDGGFRVVDPLTRFYGQATPREALRSFVRAVEHSRWDVLLALMPTIERGSLDAAELARLLTARREELTRMTALLAEALRGRPLPVIEVVGDRATMPYGESFTARLVREDELWKVEDPE